MNADTMNDSYKEVFYIPPGYLPVDVLTEAHFTP